MSGISRRELLTWFAFAPTLPRFLVDSAQAVVGPGCAGCDGPIVVVVRMLGGNDGLNTVVPFRDDRYFKARPTIAIAKQRRDCDGRRRSRAQSVAVRRSPADGRRARRASSRASATRIRRARTARSTEIWETGSVPNQAPADGWLGRYLDHACECGPEPLAGVQFARAARPDARVRIGPQQVDRQSAAAARHGRRTRRRPARGPAVEPASTTCARSRTSSARRAASFTAPPRAAAPPSTIPTPRSDSRCAGPAT